MRRLLPALLSLALAAPVAGQATSTLRPGEEVRVRWSHGYRDAFGYDASRFAIAEVVDLQEGHILLRRGRRMFTVAQESIHSLERRVGTKPASAPRMAKGSAIGFALGFAGAFLSSATDASVTSDERIDDALVGGVLVGAPVGAIIAWMTSRQRGIYERVPLDGWDARLGVGTDRTVGVRLRMPAG